MFKFITHRNLIVNVLAGAILLALIVFLFFSMLSWFTGHNDYQKVPNVGGKGFQEAKAILESKGFTVEVADSIFDINLPRLSITKQTPEAESTVKNGRTIYLTINRLTAPLVDMPNLVGFSVKSAEIYLKSLGLNIGDTSYKPDVAKNSIITQLFMGKEIKPGTKISVGSSVDLIIGSGIGNEEAEMPDLVGLTYTDALSLLGTMNISVGVPILLDNQIKDTAHAFVARQEPPVFTELAPGQKVKNKIRQGQIVDLWLSVTKPIKDTTSQTILDNPYNNQ